jgi:hypothetical protein
MKKHLLLSVSASVLFFFTSSSQLISKKDKLFGASAAVSLYNIDEMASVTGTRRSSNIGLVPSFAWAIKDNVAMGIKAGLNFSRVINGSGTIKTVQTGLHIGPQLFIRKYRTLVKNFGVSFNHEVGAYYASSSTKSDQVRIKNYSWGGGYSFTPSVFYKFSDRFLGEANIGGIGFSYNKNQGSRQWAVGGTFLTYFNIGIQYIIPSKKA